MTNTIDTKSNKAYTNLITFEYNGVYKRYAAYDSDVVVAAQTYLAVPEIELQNLAFTSFFDSRHISLKIPSSYAPVNSLIQPHPFAKVVVYIDEINVDDLTSKRSLFKGEVVNVTKSISDRSTLVTLTVATTKNLLQIPVGIPATSTCPWNFGDDNCKIDLDTVKIATTIEGVDAFTVTISNHSLVGAYAQRGFIEKDGVRIPIRVASGYELTLTRQPPTDWTVGASITVYPGCDKTLNTCRTRWNNERYFCPLGYAMPSYNPIFQQPT